MSPPLAAVNLKGVPCKDRALNQPWKASEKEGQSACFSKIVRVWHQRSLSLSLSLALAPTGLERSTFSRCQEASTVGAVTVLGYLPRLKPMSGLLQSGTWSCYVPPFTWIHTTFERVLSLGARARALSLSLSHPCVRAFPSSLVCFSLLVTRRPGQESKRNRTHSKLA